MKHLTLWRNCIHSEVSLSSIKYRFEGRTLTKLPTGSHPFNQHKSRVTSQMSMKPLQFRTAVSRRANEWGPGGGCCRRALWSHWEGNEGDGPSNFTILGCLDMGFLGVFAFWWLRLVCGCVCERHVQVSLHPRKKQWDGLMWKPFPLW